MKSMNSKMMWVPLVLLVMGASFVSADVIKGKLTDEKGKPIRGAIVKATNLNDPNKKAFAVYSQKDGQYSIDVPAGDYDVSITAYGFTTGKAKKETAQKGNLDVALRTKWDMETLTGSDVIGLIPNDAEGKLLKTTCIQCHTLEMPMRKRGYTAAEWKAFIPKMIGGTRGPNIRPAVMDALSKALEKHFGPDSQFGPDAPMIPREKVKHAEIADEGLTATITEWDIPASLKIARAHSINFDPKYQIAWFTGNAKTSSFELNGEKFEQYPTKGGHTPAIEPDGRVFVTTPGSDPKVRLAMVDPKTRQVEYFGYEKGTGPHTPMISRDGKVWISGSGGIESFEPETKQFKHYDFKSGEKNPEHSALTWQTAPGEPERKQTSFTYHLGEDSKGNIWGGSYQVGQIVRLDPKTGETKDYWVDNLLMVRGLVVDKNDNVFFGAHYDNKLGKLDPKTGKTTLYQPPSLGATPYGVSLDRKNGYIWFADMAAYTVTRFDPKTEKFVEYRLPGNPVLQGNAGPPRFIDVADDGTVWFTDYWNSRIGVLDPNGAKKKIASR